VAVCSEILKRNNIFFYFYIRGDEYNAAYIILNKHGLCISIYKCRFYISIIEFVTSLAEGSWFSPGTPISSTNKTDDITEKLLKVALNTITSLPNN
jgi:hypothetical protein